MPAKSKVVATREPPRDLGAPVLWAHGDPDDHLRLISLMAESVHARLAPGPATELADKCLQPKLPWSERLATTEAMLDEAARALQEPWLFGLHDLDGLAPPRTDVADGWDDREFMRERSELFATVLRSVGKGGWWVGRPQPAARVTEKLPARVDEGASTSLSSFEALSPVAPDCRPILDWLLTKGILSQDALDDLIHEVDDDSHEEGIEAQLLRYTCEYLKPSIQREAQRLAALRGPVPLNGVIGDFEISDEIAYGSVARTAVEALLECGFLQRCTAGSGRPAVRMPRLVRGFLKVRAEAELPEALESSHGWLAEHGATTGGLEAVLETHFHAVRGVREQIALATADGHGAGADLRELAFRLSNRREFKKAASIYKHILTSFDEYFQTYGNKAFAATERFAYGALRGLSRAQDPQRKKAVIDRWGATLRRLHGLQSLLG